jgi:hypothetical protein
MDTSELVTETGAYSSNAQLAKRLALETAGYAVEIKASDRKSVLQVSYPRLGQAAPPSTELGRRP